MTDAQGLYKTLAYKKQSGLGTAASGSGGQLLRRETATFNATKDSYSANEITSHQQHTGDKHGISTVGGSLSGLLSNASYTALLASLCRKDLAAVSAITGLTLSIASSGPGYTVTRSTGDFLTGGIKRGHVVRLTGASLDVANVGVNLVVTDVTTTVLTVMVLNGASLTEESSKASCTVTVTGKVTYVPTSGHTNDYYTFEEWYSDLSRSHLYTDVQVGQADIAFPATGNATVGLTFMGLAETKSGSQVLTTPTAETSTEVLAAVNGIVLVGGTKQVAVTGLSLTITGNMANGEAVLGSNSISDIVKGKVAVTGSFTAIFQNDTLAGYFDGETATDITIVAAENDDNDAEFVSIRLPRVKIMSADKDDGMKQIVKTYNFVAEINGAGGAALADHATIIQLQDSAA